MIFKKEMCFLSQKIWTWCMPKPDFFVYVWSVIMVSLTNRFPQDFPNQISTLPSITHAHHSLQTDKFHCISPSQNNKYNKKFIMCRLCTLKGQKNASISWRDYSFLHYMLVLKCSSCFLLFCKKSFVINTSGTVVMLLVHHFLILSRMKLVNM